MIGESISTDPTLNAIFAGAEVAINLIIVEFFSISIQMRTLILSLLIPEG